MDFFVFMSEQWMLVSVLLALVYVFMLSEQMKAGKALSTHQVTALINRDEAVLLDVRDAKEFQLSHIAGAMNIPVGALDTRLAELEKHRTKIIVVTDKMGQQASVVGRKLRRLGFQVRRLQGGMGEWLAQRLPVVSQ